MYIFPANRLQYNSDTRVIFTIVLLLLIGTSIPVSSYDIANSKWQDVLGLNCCFSTNHH